MCDLETRSAVFEAQNCQNFPVKFPVSREFGQRKVSARLPPPPPSLGCRETRLHSSENRAQSPQFCDSSRLVSSDAVPYRGASRSHHPQAVCGSRPLLSTPLPPSS